MRCQKVAAKIGPQAAPALGCKINCNFMPPINRILVPVDFSERCLKMMPYVRQFAEKYQSEVILLHVLNPVYTIPETGISGPISWPVPERAFTTAAEQLDGFATAELAGLPVRRLAYEGDPETQIAETADTEDVQLLMMPTRGHGVLRTFLLGSITAKVLHDVTRPVLTGVHAAEHSARAVSTIACASQTADVVAWATSLASDFQAKLVQVEPGPDDHADPHAVCSFAQREGADLLVIARGLQADQDGKLRANAYAIIRQSPCPVLSI